MKTISLAFLVSFLVVLAYCDDLKVKESKVNTKALVGPKFLRVGKRYYISTEQVSFVGAVIACKTGGMTLATVDSENAQSELYNATVAAPYRNGDGYWIGAAAQNPYSYNTFYWLNNAIRLIYTNWGTNQPRYVNRWGYGCVKLGNNYKVNEPSKWSSDDCNNLLNYVCEFST